MYHQRVTKTRCQGDETESLKELEIKSFRKIIPFLDLIVKYVDQFDIRMAVVNNIVEIAEYPAVDCPDLPPCESEANYSDKPESTGDSEVDNVTDISEESFINNQFSFLNLSDLDSSSNEDSDDTETGTTEEDEETETDDDQDNNNNNEVMLNIGEAESDVSQETKSTDQEEETSQTGHSEENSLEVPPIILEDDASSQKDHADIESLQPSEDETSTYMDEDNKSSRTPRQEKKSGETSPTGSDLSGSETLPVRRTSSTTLRWVNVFYQTFFIFFKGDIC